MKNLLSFLLLCILTLSQNASAQQVVSFPDPTNLIPNNSFEDINQFRVAEFWPESVTTTEKSFDGERSLHMTKYISPLSDFIPLKTGRNYTFQAQVYTEEILTIRVKFFLFDRDNELFDAQVIHEQKLKPNQWQRITVPNVNLINARNIKIQFASDHHEQLFPKKLLWDDLSLEVYNPSIQVESFTNANINPLLFERENFDTENLILNGDFSLGAQHWRLSKPNILQSDQGNYHLTLSQLDADHSTIFENKTIAFLQNTIDYNRFIPINTERIYYLGYWTDQSLDTIEPLYKLFFQPYDTQRKKLDPIHIIGTDLDYHAIKQFESPTHTGYQIGSLIQFNKDIKEVSLHFQYHLIPNIEHHVSFDNIIFFEVDHILHDNIQTENQTELVFGATPASFWFYAFSNFGLLKAF